MKNTLFILLLSLTFAFGSVQGTYLLVTKNDIPKKIMGKYIVFTFGKTNYSLSTGPHSIYEISNKRVILNGGFFNVFDISKNNLINPRWKLKRITKEASKKYLTSSSMHTSINTQSNNEPTKLPF